MGIWLINCSSSNKIAPHTVKIYTNTTYWPVSTYDEWISISPDVDNGILVMAAKSTNTKDYQRDIMFVIGGDGISNITIPVTQARKWNVGAEEAVYNNN